MRENSIVSRALQLGEKAHSGQLRKGTHEPYFVHPVRVKNLIQEIYESQNPLFADGKTITENEIAAAVLHDVLEDTNTSESEILDATNKHVLKLVKELTNPSKSFVPTEEHRRLPKGSIRKIKKQMDRDHLSNVSWQAKVIKLADRLDNVRDMKGLDDDFCLLYADESQLLLNALRGTYAPLEMLLETEIVNLRKKVKERKEN